MSRGEEIRKLVLVLRSLNCTLRLQCCRRNGTSFSQLFSVLYDFNRMKIPYDLFLFCRGPLFSDQDWLQPGYMHVHQRNIATQLVELRCSSRIHQAFQPDADLQMPIEEGTTYAGLDTLDRVTFSTNEEVLESPATSASNARKAADDKVNNDAQNTFELSSSPSVATDNSICEEMNDKSNGECKIDQSANQDQTDFVSTTLNDNDMTSIHSKEKDLVYALSPSRNLEDPVDDHASIDIQIDDYKDKHTKEPSQSTELDKGCKQARSLDPNKECESNGCDARAGNAESTSPSNNSTSSAAQLKPSSSADHYHKDIDRAQLLALIDEQVNRTQFPIGCKIWSSFQPSNSGEFFRSGKVLGAFFHISSRELLYNVLFEDGCRSLLNDTELAYAPGCPVLYSPSSFRDEEDGAAGQILICRTKRSLFSYSIMISTEGSDELQLVEDIPSSQIKWRHIAD